jgi:hypothetical protein
VDRIRRRVEVDARLVAGADPARALAEHGRGQLGQVARRRAVDGHVPARAERRRVVAAGRQRWPRTGDEGSGARTIRGRW